MNTAGSDLTTSATETVKQLSTPTSEMSDLDSVRLIKDCTAVQPVHHATTNLTEELKYLSEILSEAATADSRLDIGSI